MWMQESHSLEWVKLQENERRVDVVVEGRVKSTCLQDLEYEAAVVTGR